MGDYGNSRLTPTPTHTHTHPHTQACKTQTLAGNRMTHKKTQRDTHSHSRIHSRQMEEGNTRMCGDVVHSYHTSAHTLSHAGMWHTHTNALTHSGPVHSTSWTMDRALQLNPSSIPYYEESQPGHET